LERCWMIFFILIVLTYSYNPRVKLSQSLELVPPRYMGNWVNEAARQLPTMVQLLRHLSVV